jgi:HD superfamily phosphohydrolase
MPSKEVRDPIHGLIEFSPEEWLVIGSAPMQRLRGIQQLAMTHLVYPGARHSRWEHCVGVAHVAGRLSLKTGIGGARTKLVRMAALTHDLGHGPFSHVSEEVFDDRTGRKHVHESISAAILRHNDEIRSAMGAEAADWAGELLTSKGHAAKRSIERDIVAGPADADKLDYLLRDSHYCGVKYGEYDLDKLVESARKVTEKLGDETYLGFHEEAIYSLEEMLLARYHMHRQVYGHRTRVATDRMLVRAIELGIEEKAFPKDFFKPSDDPDKDFVSMYLDWDDARVIKLLIARKSKAGDVMRAVVERHLFKRVLDYGFDDLVDAFGRPSAGDVAGARKAVLIEQRPKAEQIVAKAIGVEPHWVSLHWDDIENPIASRFSFKIAGKEIIVVGRDKRPYEFNETSDIFSDTEAPSRVQVSLFARLTNDRSEKDLGKQERNRIKTAMNEALAIIGKAEAEAPERT